MCASIARRALRAFGDRMGIVPGTTPDPSAPLPPKTIIELIRFNGAELAYKVHNCDFFEFTYDPLVRCSGFLEADPGTPQVVSYREIR